MRIFKDLKFDFLSKRKTAYIISGTLLFLGIVSLALRGLELGIDFKGGTEIGLQFEKPIDITELRSYGESFELGKIEVKTFGGDKGALFRTEVQDIPSSTFHEYVSAFDREIERLLPGVEREIVDSTTSDVIFAFSNPDTTNYLNNALFKAGFQTSKVSQEPDNKQIVIRVGIADVIEEKLKERFPDNPFTILKEDQVGPKIGDELKLDTMIAIVLALVVILIYLGFRFKFVFAVGAVTALFHDVMITLGLFSLLYGFISWLNLEISINVVAAFLTLIGYSINDTVVVFDRIRENLKIHKTAPLADNINKAISSTMPRTIITSVTTLFVTLVLIIFGGDVLRGFAFTLFIGVLIGTYSSIFVASSFVYDYAMKSNRKIQFQ